MQRLIFIVVILFFTLSCSVQRQLSKAYVGKPASVLKAKFGFPETVLERDGEKVYVFEEIEHLKSTEISQAKLTLDPMISPSVQKTTRYYFTVKDNKIVKAKLEEEYER
jgi:hypothetical protein